MELAELQETWSKLHKEIDSQKKLSDKMIMDIVKLKYNNKLKNILKYEGAGTVVLFVALIIVIWNIQLFDTLPLQICAVVCISVMAILPILSLTSVYRLNNMDMSKRTYKEMLVEFTKRRTYFLSVQKWGTVASVILMLAIIPVMLKISKGKDFFEGDSNNLLWFIPIAQSVERS